MTSFVPLPLVAFDLASPAMLGWLAAAAAPILIHLWSRRRYREMPWAAMEYLLAAVRANRRRVQLEQWLLLAVRTLLVILVVLALAEPFFERPGLGFVSGEPTHHVLVLDGSYSMAYRPTAQTRFDRAKELARRIVRESPQGDGFTLVLMSNPPRVVIGNPVFEARDFLPELNRLALPHTTIDLAATLAQVEQVLQRARREQPRLKREEVCFLTDLGRVGWAADWPSATAKAQTLGRFQRLARSANLVILDVGQPEAENVAVTSARTSETFATPARDIEITAELRNFGRQPRNRQPVELLVDGRRAKEARVDLPAGGQAAALFSYQFDTAGDHQLEVRTEGDALDVDNHRWISVPVKEQLRVLCVDGQSPADPSGGATGFLRYALAPEGDEASSAAARPEIVPESALLETDLACFDAVFLANVAQFTADEARVLEAYLKSGGNLVFFLGDRVLADRYNVRLAGEGKGGVQLLPARLGEVVHQPHQRLDPLGYRHPIVQAFRAREKAGLLTAPVYAYFKLLVPKDSSAKVALALDDGSPLIVESPVHEGRVVLVATSADASWTDLPRWPSYLPLVQEILSFAVGGRQEQKNLLVGQPLGQTLPAAMGDVSLTVRTPAGASETVRPQIQGDYAAWSFSGTSLSGVYAAQFSRPPTRRDLFAVNVDPAESDLTKLSAEELRSQWPGVPLVHQTTWKEADEPPMVRSQGTGELAKSLLFGVLGLLFAETFLARRFGHHAT